MAEQKDAKKQKRPTALKRDAQSLKKQALNRAFKSKVNTAMKSFKQSVSQKDAAKVQEKANIVYSLMDNGVKKKIIKKNKASRVKSSIAGLAKTTA